MTWSAQGDGRWVLADDVRHVLLWTGGQFVELHGVTVHVYEAGDPDSPDNPLGGAAWVSTEVRPALAEFDDDKVWQALTGPGRADAPRLG